MTKPTFLTYEKPLLTCMVQADNPERIRELITRSRPEGAEAFGMQFCRMKAIYRNRETYRALFDFAAPQPVYVTNYRGGNAEKSSALLFRWNLKPSLLSSSLAKWMVPNNSSTQIKYIGVISFVVLMVPLAVRNILAR